MSNAAKDILSVTLTTNGATLPGSKLEQSGALAHLKHNSFQKLTKHSSLPLSGVDMNLGNSHILFYPLVNSEILKFKCLKSDDISLYTIASKNVGNNIFGWLCTSPGSRLQSPSLPLKC